MRRLEQGLADLETLSRLHQQAGWLSRLDPRALIVSGVACLAFMASFPKYEVAGVIPLAAYPILLISLGRIPFGIVARTVAAAAPFAVMVGILNPLLDRTPVVWISGVEVSGGWLSLLSIILRATLSISVAVALVGCAGFGRICVGLRGLGCPRVLVTQLQFMYRYLFVLTREGSRMVRARELRAAPGRRPGLREWTHLSGRLLIRAYERGQRVHMAMRCRGYAGEMRTLAASGFGLEELLFISAWLAWFAFARWGAPAQRLGDVVLGGGT